MALISCPECSRKVSDSAPSCPNCGVAIAAAVETRASGARLITTQETSKKLKMQSLISIALIVFGFVSVFTFTADPADPAASTSPWPGLMIAAGFVWYIVTRFRIWWHHK